MGVIPRHFFSPSRGTVQAAAAWLKNVAEGKELPWKIRPCPGTEEKMTENDGPAALE